MRRVLIAACLILATGGCVRGRTFELLRVDAPEAEATALELYLIGDAGLPALDGEPVLTALSSLLRDASDRSFVVFLGDNVYPAGLPAEGDLYRPEAERILDAQLGVLKSTGARGLFVPGNHDWQASGPAGRERIARQERYVYAHANGHALFLPSEGCPGPEALDVGEHLRLVVLDTQWWLHPWDRPFGKTSSCPAAYPEDVTAALTDMLEDAHGRATVVVAHHPLESGGEHGDYADWPSYRALPYSIIRRSGFTNQDLGSPVYERMRGALERALEANPPLVYAAGHEHNLQILAGPGGRFHLVSGAGIYGHTTPVRIIPRTRYAKEASGFMRLSLLRDGRVRLAVVTVDPSGTPTEDYSIWLTEKSDPK